MDSYGLHFVESLTVSADYKESGIIESDGTNRPIGTSVLTRPPRFQLDGEFVSAQVALSWLQDLLNKSENMAW